jgi:hypothetical protein
MCAQKSQFFQSDEVTKGEGMTYQQKNEPSCLK